MDKNIFIGFTLEQFPLESNDYSAVVSKSIKTEDGKVFRDFGVATMHEHNTSDAAILINNARRNAQENLVKNMRQSNTSQALSQQSSTHRRTNTMGGGAKPASDAQLNFINKLCNEKDVNMNDIISEMGFDKEKLTGSESNTIIRKLKGK